MHVFAEHIYISICMFGLFGSVSFFLGWMACLIWMHFQP